MFLKSLRENLAGYLCSKMGEKSKKKKKKEKLLKTKQTFFLLLLRLNTQSIYPKWRDKPH